MQEAIEKYTNLLVQKRYSKNTIKTYCNYFEDFLTYFKAVNELEKIQDVTKSQINTYILGLINTKNISTSQQNQRINAIKFYYEKVLGREKQYYNLHRPKEKFIQLCLARQFSRINTIEFTQPLCFMQKKSLRSKIDFKMIRIILDFM